MRGLTLCLVALLAACRQDMHDQPKYKPYAKNESFPDHRASRPLVEGTVARGQLVEGDALHTGKVGGQPVTELPVELTLKLIETGRSRYDTFCAPCHGRAGRGDGMVVQRGFKAPSSYHVDRLRQVPIGYFFDVMTNGFGAMSDYRAQIAVHDRWAIAAYIRALQLSQNATLEDVPGEKRGEVEAPPLPEAH
jgi:cytochrome c553